MQGNYWGTTSEGLIQFMIHDYDDDFNLGQIVYQPFLSVPSTTTYPFVVDVTLTTSLLTHASALNGPTPEVGAEICHI